MKLPDLYRVRGVLTLVIAVALILAGRAGAQDLRRVEQADFGKTQDNSEVRLITLRNVHGMSVQIISYGAIMMEVHAKDRNGKLANVLMTTDTLAKYEHGFPAAAAVIGRVVNRIAGAQFLLDGTAWHLPANERKNTIHGGPHGFAQAVWTVEEVPEKAEEAAIKLIYLSKDGEQGFPEI